METEKAGKVNAEYADATEIANDGGKDAISREHTMSLLESFKVYRKAIFWSMCISFSCVMEGYDTNLIASFYALPAFQEKYGISLGNGNYTISANWQIGLSIAATAGMMIGGGVGGYLVERIGYRRLFIGAYMFLIGFIFITFFAPSIEVLFVGELLCGMCWGVFSSLVNAYGSEILPAKLRTFLLMFVEMCWAIGNLISAGVLYSFVGNSSKWAYKVPFAIQWAWIIPLLVGVYFAPESPWWLVRKNRLEEAEKTLARLSGPENAVNIKSQLAMMVHTNEIELHMQTGVTYMDLFKGVDRRRTEISCMAQLATSVTCFGIPGYTTYFFELAGLPVADAYKINIGQTAIGLFANMCGQINGRFFGRRTLYIWGLGFLTIDFLVLALISFADTKASMWVQSVMLLLWSLSYSQTIGPTGFIVPSEISSTRLRAKTTALARICYYVPTIISSVVSPYMLNETKGNWKGKAAFFTAGLSLIWYLWAFFRLPESKHRTYAELDILFANRVKARDFTKFDVEVYGSDEHMITPRADVSSNLQKLLRSKHRATAPTV